MDVFQLSRRFLRRLAIPAASWALALSVSNAATLHVTPTGSNTSDGLSWGTAKKSVAAALVAARAGDQVWVAAGRYLERIILPDGVALYGGFAGTESSPDARDSQAHETILDGARQGVVVTIKDNAGPGTRLDGFTVTGGTGIHGAGIRVTLSAPVIANNRIVGNETDGAGAGVSIWGPQIVSPSLARQADLVGNLFLENRAIHDEGDGGGLAVIGASPRIAFNVFLRNEATRNGGAICCWRSSSPLIANNVIRANSASVPPDPLTDFGTLSLGGGAIFASASDLDGRPIPDAVSAPLIVANLIAANAADRGGGLCLVDSIRTDLGVARVRHNTIVANSGDGVFWSHRVVVLENNVVALNTSGLAVFSTLYTGHTNRFNCVHGNHLQGRRQDYLGLPDLTGADGNLSLAPRFANPSIGDFHLQPDSPCLNAAGPFEALTDERDFEGDPRLGDGHPDIGADESDLQFHDAPTPVIFIRTNGNDTADGRSWEHARQTIASALATSLAGGGEIRVAAGTYRERFTLPAFVHLYGGFAGTETQRDQRRPDANPTILDGGGLPTVVRSANAGYLVSTLDGFIVQGGGHHSGGSPFGVTPSQGLGGACYARVSSPLLAHNLFRSNSIGTPYTAWYAKGGGFAGYLSHAVLATNTIVDNEVLAIVDGAGGGVYLNRCFASLEGNFVGRNHAKIGPALWAGYSAPRLAGNTVVSNAFYVFSGLFNGASDGALTLISCTNFVLEANVIRGNVAASGAGLSLASCFDAVIRNNLIADNYSWDPTLGTGGWGGGVWCLVNINATADLVFLNNTLLGNSAAHRFAGEQGGGFALTVLKPHLVLANNLLASNSSGIWLHPGSTASPTLRRNLLHNSNQVDYVNLQAGQTDLRLDPRLDPGPSRDGTLLPDSPAIDAGFASFTPALDRLGVPRPLDGDGDGQAAVDLGALEFIHATADTDRDGLPDAWEWNVDLNLLLADATADPDHDGQPNFAEHESGTNPRDPTSVLRLQLIRSPATAALLLRFPSEPGHLYQLLSAPALDRQAAWQSVSDALIPGTGGWIERELPPSGEGARFFRVSVTAP